MGHEFCCEVVELGPGCANLAAGDIVVSLPVAFDAEGLHGVGFSNRYSGGYAELMVVNELMAIKVPTGLPARLAALTEPLAVGVHAVAKSGIQSGEAALVIGLGPVGLAVIAELRMRGIGPIVGADFSPKRRDLAARLGADEVVDPAVERAVDAWRRVDGTRPLVIFEAVGVPGMIDQAMRMAPKGTRILVVGACMQPDTFHPMIGIGRELSIQFVLGYEPHEFGGALTAIADGRVDLEPWLTGSVGVEGIPQAFVDLDHPDAHAKILVRADMSDTRPHDPNDRTTTVATDDTFPRQYARTQRFTLGEPREHRRVARRPPDRVRPVARRQRSGQLPVGARRRTPARSGSSPTRVCCWRSPTRATSRRGAGPPRARPRGRRRRRGVRHRSATSRSPRSRWAAGCSWPGWCRRVARELAVDGPVFDPRPEPTASPARRLRERPTPAGRRARRRSRSWRARRARTDVSWGSAEFVAAEEMDRSRGFWWSPDGQRSRPCRVDTSPVPRWWIADPAHPETSRRRSIATRPPGRPTPSSSSTSSRSTAGRRGDRLGPRRVPVPRRRLVDRGRTGCSCTVQSRDQRRLSWSSAADGVTGRRSISSCSEDIDDAGSSSSPASPGQLGRRAARHRAADRDGARRLLVDGEPRHPAGSAGPIDRRDRRPTVVFHANPLDEPTTSVVHWRWSDAGGLERRSSANPASTAPRSAGRTVVVRSSTLGGRAHVT